MVKEIEKGEIYWKRDPDDPLSDAYYTVVQNHTMDEEAKAISRIIKDFDESDLAKSGKKIEDNQQLLMYRLYELNCNKQLDIKNISVDDFNTLTKYADWFGKIGNVADILEYGGYAANAVSAYLDGNTKGVTDEFAKAIGSAASGFIAQQLAGVLITTFAVTNPLVAYIEAKKMEIESLTMKMDSAKLLYEAGELSKLELKQQEAALAKAQYELEQYYVEMNLAYINLITYCK